MSSENQLIERRFLLDARNALLRHYSSKSTNQTIIILTIGILFFTFVETIQYIERWPSSFRTLYFIVSLTTCSFLAIRALGRLFLWGKMAGAVTYVLPLTEQQLKKGKHLDEKLNYMFTHHLKLDRASSEEAHKTMYPIGKTALYSTREPYCYVVLTCMITIIYVLLVESAILQFTVESLIVSIVLAGLIALFGCYSRKRKQGLRALSEMYR